MKDKEIVKFKMFKGVLTVMNSSKGLFAEVKELEKSFESLTECVKTIEALIKEQEKDLSILTTKKADARTSLIEKAVPVTNIILAYAYDIKDNSYFKKMDFSKNKLVKAKDQALKEKCSTISKVARKLFASVSISENNKTKNPNITDYGLTGQIIDELEVRLAAFTNTLKLQKDALIHKSNCTKKMGEKFQETEKLLKNKIDRLMTIYLEKNSRLYFDYKNARALEVDKLEVEVKKPIVSAMENNKAPVSRIKPGVVSPVKPRSQRISVAKKVVTPKQSPSPDTIKTETKTNTPIKNEVATVEPKSTPDTTEKN